MKTKDHKVDYALGLLNTVASPELDKNFSYIESAVGVVISRVSTILDNGDDALELNQVKNIIDILSTAAEICEKISARKTICSTADALQSLLK